MINSYSGLDYSLEKYVKILSIEDILKDLTIEKSYWNWKVGELENVNKKIIKLMNEKI